MRSDLPRHIAIIMDGNGRWAKKRLLPRKLGHREGVKTIDRIADAVFARGVEVLTLFAFSTENWNRPREEVDGLLGLFKKYIRKKTPEMVRKNIRLLILGDSTVFDDEIRSLIAEAYEKTGNNTAGTLCICFNYGGHRRGGQQTHRERRAGDREIVLRRAVHGRSARSGHRPENGWGTSHKQFSAVSDGLLRDILFSYFMA